MLRLFFLCMLVVAVCTITPYYDEATDARYKQAYYASANNATYWTLNKLITSTHAKILTYDEARKQYLYPAVDRHPDGKLHGIYTNTTFNSLMRGYDIEFNCEHTMPQSWFNEKLPMRGDLHHLFTAEPHCNSYRSNFAHGQFDNGETIVSKREGCGMLFLGSEESFEPHGSKGPVARAILYFLVRYPRVIKESFFNKENLAEMVTWAKEPLTLWEKHRNAEIYAAQGNRNPFIDFPELVSKIEFYDALA
jgi:deoxyribonuclease-1